MKKIISFIQESQYGGIFFALFFTCIFFSFQSEQFPTWTNFVLILNQISVNAILAFGVTFVIIAGGIDLSLGSILAVSGVVAALFAKEDSGSVGLSILLALLVGTLMGLINGLITVFSKVPPFIVTLGSMTIGRGLALLISDGKPVSGLLESFNSIGNGDLFGIPYSIILLILTFLISTFLLDHSILGRYIKAIGGNEMAAFVSGISVNKIKCMVYGLSGLFAAIGAVLLTARINTGQPNAGLGFELDAIAAVIIGGTSTKGGKGSMLGTFIGVFFIGIINNGLDLLNVSAYWQQVVMGGIIILAVLFDRLYSHSSK
jgi:inositol transport system permease protein